MLDFPFKRINKDHIYNIFEPDSSKITVEYIAFTLSGINRFGGDAYPFYSVAQHSINCKLYSEFYYPNDPLLHMSSLLHDATEAILGDVISTLKPFIYFKSPDGGYVSFSDMEIILSKDIEYYLGYELEYGKYKEADIAVRVKESDVCVGRPVDEAECEYDLREPPECCNFDYMDRADVIREFLKHYYILDKDIQNGFNKPLLANK